MELTVIESELKRKIKEAKKISGFNSRHFAFKNWHATVMQLLRELPSSYLPDINEFKKLSFEDTRFKRGRKFLSSPDNSRFVEDLEASVNILKGIIKKGKQEDKKKESVSVKKEKPSKPKVKKSTSKKPAARSKKTGTSKAAGIKKAPVTRKPVKKGNSPTRKKKKP
jgi:hypothetical protein